MDRLEELSLRIEQFNKDREWDQFHSPSNLAKSISIEANELLECFQWNDTEYDLECNLSNKVKKVPLYQKKTKMKKVHFSRVRKIFLKTKLSDIFMQKLKSSFVISYKGTYDNLHRTRNY